MNLYKKSFIFIFIIFGISWGNLTLAQISTTANLKTGTTSVEFKPEDIEKLKTLIENHFKTRISDAEFSKYGRASEENLALYKLLNETRKEDTFFSQPHISFIIESMEDRLGMKKPKSKSSLNITNERTDIPKVSKLPKNKSDNPE